MNRVDGDPFLSPREYQVEFLQRAQKENIIVYLPTGSGKTLIASLLIRENDYETTRPLARGGRRTIFLVPTVVLAQQQSDYVRRHTNLRVKEYYGSSSGSLWKGDRWANEFEKNQVLVMTAQLFLNILTYGFFSVANVNILVVDECHDAVRDAPVKQVLDKVSQCDASTRPRILGLTAALFRRRLKPKKTIKVIEQLCDTMKAIVCLPSDWTPVLERATNPRQLVCAYADQDPHQTTDVEHLRNTITLTFKELTANFTNTLKESDCTTKYILDVIRDLTFLLEAFGVFGVYHGSEIYLKVLDTVKHRTRLDLVERGIERLRLGITKVSALCKEEFDKNSESPFELNRWLTPRVLRLFEILSGFKPTNNQAAHFSAIVFVERRSSANVLYHLIKEASKGDERLDFIRPQFTMGQSSNGNTFKESDVLGLRQRDIMKQFRDGQCNLLVATSVLEEGIDIPACNVIVRFDPLKTFCEYVQSKGRARSRKSWYIIMANGKKETELSDYLDKLAEFHAIEQGILMDQEVRSQKFFTKCGSLGTETVELSDGQPGEEQSELDARCRDMFAAYMPFGPDGPSITMLSAVSLINRYCSVLSSDPIPLLPDWTIEEISSHQISPRWPSAVHSKVPSKLSFQNFYRCRLVLPLNSPLREEVVGEVLPSKRGAKQAAALKACKELHRLKELDDAHLLPVLQSDEWSVPDEEMREEFDASGLRLGSSKRRKVFPKAIADALRNCLPRPGHSSFVYVLDFRLVSASADEKKFYHPNAIENKMAIMSSKCLPNVCTFPLATRAGEVDVEVVGVDRVVLDERQLEKLREFHRYLIEDVILLFKTKEEFDFHNPTLGLLIVPLKKSDMTLDFDLVERIIASPPIDWDTRPDIIEGRRRFQYDPLRYIDAVLTPYYKGPNQRTVFYVDSITRLTPSSPFPDDNFSDYAKFFKEKYQLTMSEKDQNLLQVSREVSGKNFLLRRKITCKVDPIHLVPEFCAVHALPASLWKQVVWIPCVLERLNRLLVAEELRVRITKETGIGAEFLPRAMDGCLSWPSLREHLGNDDQPRQLKGPIRNIQSNDDVADANPRQNERECSTPKIDESACMDMTCDDGPCGSIAEAATLIPPSICNDFRNKDEERNTSLAQCSSPNPVNWYRSFDCSSTCRWGPGPGLILEALTMRQTHEGFDMERMETIGDSLLKLVISIYVYGQSTNSRKCTEGLLTVMRKRQISNRNLYLLGQRAELGSAIVAAAFDLKSNFLPPCVSTDGDENARRVSQTVSDKNIADCVEALTGAYLLSSGVAGGIKFLQWIGLKTIPDGLENKLNPLNGFPLLADCYRVASSPDREEMLQHLYSGLDGLEREIGYTFQDKTLLMEALSHPSYFPNRLTGSYQRLEFLGDAVLDYLVTRFFFDDERKYSPASLTDLRSATVSNATFAVLAVRHGFHTFLKHSSPSLECTLDKFIRIQIENNHKLLDDYFLVDDDDTACDVAVPKVLSDIFESVAGAIFVDSGMSLDAVWKSYYPFLHQEMVQFRCNIPKSPLRMFHEKFPGIALKKSGQWPSGQICVEVQIGGKTLRSVGCNGKIAKCAAAKRVLREVKVASAEK